MAAIDEKISELDELLTPADEDLLAIVDDPSGSPIIKRITRQNFLLDNISCRVYKSASQSIPNNTTTAVTFDLESFDNGGLHSTVANTERITIVKAGIYIFIAQVEWASNVYENRKIRIRKNGSNIASVDIDAPDATAPVMQISIIDSAAVADYYDVTVYQNSGVALNVISGAGSTWFSAVRVSRSS